MLFRIHHVETDVSDPAAVKEAVDCAIKHFPSIDVLVNNVAVQYGVSDDGTKRGASEVRPFTHLTDAILHQFNPCSTPRNSNMPAACFKLTFT